MLIFYEVNSIVG